MLRVLVDNGQIEQAQEVLSEVQESKVQNLSEASIWYFDQVQKMLQDAVSKRSKQLPSLEEQVDFAIISIWGLKIHLIGGGVGAIEVLQKRRAFRLPRPSAMDA